MSERRRKAARYLNREMSWLEFNQRVLDEALDESVPLLERLKFLAITASNLDEFFMVRVGGLRMLHDAGKRRRDISGLTPGQQLRAIARRVRGMVRDQYAGFDRLDPALAAAGIRRLQPAALDPDQERFAARLFDGEVFPLLTPRGIDPDEEFPLLPGLTLILAVRLRVPGGAEGEADGERLAVVPIPRNLPRTYHVPGEDTGGYMLAEDLAAAYLERLFPGEEVIECAPFRLTRNADLSVREDLAADLLARMEDVLVARRLSDCLRLEISASASRPLVRRLAAALGVPGESIYRAPGPLDLSAFFGFASMPGHDELKETPWPPCPSPQAPAGESMFEAVRRRDILIFTPYESFKPVVRFVEEAAADPRVLAIKQILYRTSSQSPVVAALARAAEAGKQVTALVELKARFDEARNIDWARALERAGVQVIYGIRRLKTHAKICLVVRREDEGIRRYLHLGTGNYNERTARLYSDVSLLTCTEDYGLDGSAFFNAITGYSQPLPYRRIEAAPLGLRARLLELIRGETQRAAQGQKARIMAKVNSLADPTVIDALYEASRAGVPIDLSVRGICCLRPGVPGLSETIRVVSVVDRFLEHARLFYFHQGGNAQVLFSSADWMPRNLDKRIELLVPVLDPAARRRLVGILKTCMADNVKGRVLRADGGYDRPARPARVRAVRSQAVFYEEARRAAQVEAESRKAVFEPHRPPSDQG